jgi:hypothetical protein
MLSSLGLAYKLPTTNNGNAPLMVLAGIMPSRR